MTQLGRYEVLEELGRGAMGAVFLARDPVIDRTVAIKTILTSGQSPEEAEGFRKRFFREAQAAGRLSHPGIVTIHDVGEDESSKTPYIVMEFIAGKTLERLLGETEGALPVETSLDLAKQVAEALDYAHAQGIVHRDIKPANIMITPAGRAKIADFGVARLRQTQMTVIGEVLGTPGFMSPEQFEGKRADGRSDLFSLGVMLYSMLTGQKPFAGEDLSEVMFKVVYKDPPAATEANPRLSPAFDYVLSRALAKDPGRRYQNGKELADDLEDLRQSRPPRSQAAAALEPSGRPAIERTQALGKTVALKPQERASDQEPTLARTLPLRTTKPGAVVAVDWNRLGGYAKTAGQKALALSLLLAKHGAAFAKTLPQRLAQAVELARRGWAWIRARPRSVQILLGVAVLAGVAGVVIYSMSVALAPTTNLYFTLRHDLRAGELSISVNGREIAEATLAGEPGKRLGVFRRVQGSYSTTLQVPIGKRTVRVRVTSADESFDETREIEAEFSEGQELTLYATCESRRNSLTLSLR